MVISWRANIKGISIVKGLAGLRIKQLGESLIVNWFGENIIEISFFRANIRSIDQIKGALRCKNADRTQFVWRISLVFDEDGNCVISAKSDNLCFWVSTAMLALVILILVVPYGLPRIFSFTLGLSLFYRLLLTLLILAPIGFLMGIPFPAGIQWLQTLYRNEEPLDTSTHIPWIWATNGAASVVSSILAALLALTFGFNWVLKLGALCYIGALLTVLYRPQSPRR